VIRTIHCTVVEVPAMSDPFQPQEREFRDLVPWADPYIAALLEKLRQRAAFEDELAAKVAAELPPPLDKSDRGDRWEADWSGRAWPRG
jgi:hypothetical protein